MRINYLNGVAFDPQDYPALKCLDVHIGTRQVEDFISQLKNHLQQGDQLLVPPPDSPHRLRAFLSKDFLPYALSLQMTRIHIKDGDEQMKSSKAEDDEDADYQIPPPQPILPQPTCSSQTNMIPNRDQVLAWVLDNCAQALRWPTNEVDFRYRQRFMDEVIGYQDPIK